MQRTSNPVLSKKTFVGLQVAGETDVMTINGTVYKTALLLIILVISSVLPWNAFVASGERSSVLGYVSIGALGGFGVAILTVFKKNWAAFTSPIYAILEGFAVGGVSVLIEARFPGVVLQAVCLTFGTLFALLFLYRTGVIKATENFKLGVFAATSGIAILYFSTWILGMFDIHLSFIHEGGLWGILFSLFVVVIAALNLVLDFDFIESGCKNGAPKYMEWYAAFGLIVTLVWLYLEILRLLGKSRK